MMKDNFSNPNPFLSQAKQFQELVNQPTAADAMADANIRSMIPNPRNEGEILANSLSSGFAGGLKAHENQKRQEKLSPILERAGQITAKAAELEAQMQDETQTKMDTEKFYRRVAPAMLERSKAALAGDTSAVSELDKYIYGVLQQSVKDPSLGPYSHSNGSNTYFTNNETGVDEGRNLMQTMYQYGIDPAQIFGKDAMNVEIGYSPGAKLKYEDERKMLAAELAQKNSVTSVNNAQAGNYNAQTEKTQHEIKNPEEPYNKELANHNLTHIKEQRERNTNAKALVATLNDLEGMIKDANKKGQAGSTLKTTGNRLWAKYLSGDNESATLADMAKAAYFARVKEGGGSNPSTTEFLTVLETVPNIDKNPQAALKRLQFDREQALKTMYRYKKTEEGLRKTKYQGSPDDEAVFKHNDDEYKTFSKQYYTPKVTIQAPDGTIALVSPEYADDLVNNKGGKVIDE